MSRRTVISGSLTLLLALVVWWLADAMVSTPPPGDAGNSREEARAAQASSAEAAQPLPSASVQSATDREAVTVFDASAPDIVWSDVRIVDGASGVAVADAEVGCLDGAAWERLMAMPAAEREALLGDTWRCVAEFGRSVRSDDAGRARVRLDRSVTVHARHAGSYGRLVVVRDTDVPPGGHQLELWPERGMQVVVRDASGQPAVAVPLVVTMHAASGEALGDYGLWPAPQTHAPDGVARFEHMQGWRPSDELAAPIAAWRVGVALPGLREVAATFDPAAPPPAPIVLQLPPAGEVVARVVMQGRVVHLSHGFTLGLDEPERGGATRTREAIADAAGAAHFEQVPVHGRFRVAAYLGGWISRVVDGPREPGQIVAVDIEVDPADHVLIGRLLDPDGVALTKASVTMQFDLGGASARCNFVTDAGGRFAWRFRDLPHDPVDLSRADLRVDVGDRPPLRAVVPPRRLGRGVNDVGELRTEQVEVVVTGTWRGLDRLDRSEVRLQVERFAAGEDGAATSWWPVGGLTPRLFADGRFAVYGSVEPARLR
ncbi:MAG: hypothetical protein KDC48_12660, partial [Planctomycetes bacterium]|nr:hypothetical protein [Planctomycetota bacterium]